MNYLEHNYSCTQVLKANIDLKSEYYTMLFKEIIGSILERQNELNVNILDIKVRHGEVVSFMKNQ